MKIRHFYQAPFQVLRHHSTLQIGLRHGKIMINILLRWCSVGLLSSYTLMVVASVHFVDLAAFKSLWLTYLITALFVFLFLNLLFIQDRYSEKRNESAPVGNSKIPLNSFYVSNHYKTNKRLVVIYLIASIIGWLPMTITPLPIQPAATILFLIFAVILYVIGLLLLRNLLKEKCAIRQLNGRFGYSKNC